jgi:hypothetical protein
MICPLNSASEYDDTEEEDEEEASPLVVFLG